MKSITYPSISALALCLLLAGVAFAQEDIAIEAGNSVQADLPTDDQETVIESETLRDVTQEIRDAARADIAASATEARAEVQAQQAERRTQLNERARERITNLAANISNRMDAAAARMQNITTRLESRINKLEASGLDTTEAAIALASAQRSIDAAVTALARIDITVQNAVTAEDPKAAWVEVRAAYTAIREQLRTANTELRASVQALKDTARATDNNRGSAAAVQTQQQQ